MHELLRQEIAALRAEVLANDRRYAEQDKFRQDALDIALRTANTRLDGMNEFRGALSDQSARMITRPEFDILSEKLVQQTRPNWPLMVSAASIVLALFTGGWLVIGLQISTAVAPMQLSLEQNRSGLVNAEARLVASETNASLQREQQTRQTGALVEIETQFCAQDQVRNLAHAADMRLIAMLWHQTFPGAIYPTDNAYYAQICQRPDTSAAH
jgi:hypothetical protein